MIYGAIFLWAGCQTEPQGLRETPIASEGPMIVIDWEADPLPELPFPNNLATRPDSGSPTGRRLNISLVAVTEHESEIRGQLNQMTGFGIFSPISVSFSTPLDLDNIAARHRDDPNLDDTQFEDDAFFLINVDPNSPGYLQAVPLEVGHGRYPMDVPNSARFFPNDSRDGSPTVIFDTVDEDTNGNGVLDWGEDTDNDGILDIPNLYPIDGDPVDDLLPFYERATNTLLIRPVDPLYEETTYAVVLTNRLVGEDGFPVRSPWKYIHHLDQTEELSPLPEALSNLGLSLEDVAFAWTYSTGRVTGDLVDIRLGLYGEGPFQSLETEYPAGVEQAHVLHDIDGISPYTLPLSDLVDILLNLDLLEGEGGDIAADSFSRYASHMVGGSFFTPYFLVDKDDDGRDDSDEQWELDPMQGTYTAAPMRIPFTCALPSESTGASPPYDVVIYGHGYGSSRLESLSFGWVFTQLGYAFCFMDFPGHGPSINENDLPAIESVLDANHLLPFLTHLRDSRSRDLNNDGKKDSGGDQWSADVFHTRDMVRQAVVDWMQFVRSFKECGNGQMVFDDGSEATSCDWDDDGTIDLGGPDVNYYILGGSLGGINSAVAAAVMPEVEAFVPVAGGAGLFDMALRTEIGGAVEAMHGRIMGPLFLGYPVADSDALRIVQMVNSERRMKELPIATIESFPKNGKIVIENQNNGEVREGLIPEDGRFRLAMPCDGLDPSEKRLAAGIPDTGPEEGVIYQVSDNKGLGDPLRITIYDEAGERLHTIEQWSEDVLHEGVTMPAGSPLVAGTYGSGRIRGSSNLRRIASIFGAALEAGDPISYAPHYFLRPFEKLGGEQTNVLLMPTIGDSIVPVSAGITMARAAGIIDQTAVDERYGMTVDQWLVEKRVIQGVEQYGPYVDINGESCLFDADDLDNGLDGTGAPSEAPLRVFKETDVGISGLRLPYISTRGAHGFSFPEPSNPGDQNSFAVNSIAHYFLMNAQELSADPCMSDFTCDWIPALDVNTQEDGE
ncbi:MAG: hypothetical protein VX278_23650 [Myxococcota bacterium]|nr:hypothetical protein [Myxococcota bacterium]